MMDLLPPLSVTFTGIIAILVLQRAQLPSFAAALAMLQWTGGPVSSSVLVPTLTVDTSQGRVCRMSGCLLVHLATLQAFLWGQFREMCWLDKQPKQSLFDVKNCILSEYDFHLSVRQSSRGWLLMQYKHWTTASLHEVASALDALLSTFAKKLTFLGLGDLLP